MEIARREFLAGTAGAMAAMITGGCASMTGPPQFPKFAYVGCYTSQQRRGAARASPCTGSTRPAAPGRNCSW